MVEKLRPEQNRLNTVEEASRRLSVTIDYIRRHIRFGSIVAVKFGKGWRISEDEMQRIMREGLTPPKIIPNTGSHAREAKRRGIIR